MKNLFRLFLVIFSLFAIVSCGGEDTSASDEEQKINVSIRSISDIAAQIAAMHFLINDEAGNVLFEDSLGIEKLGNKTVLTGIKNGENATLTIRVFAKNAQGDTESTPKWIGKVRGLNFKKGKTTGVDIMLYSATVGNTETVMPSPLMIPRFGHTATVLDDGRVLIAGGFTSCTSNHKCQVTKSVEIIDVETGHVEHLADMLEARAMHHAVKMGDGSIVFIGGVSGLNTIAQSEDEAFENYPPLPYSFSASSAVTKMERYVLNYLPFNQRKNNSGTVDYDTLPESYSEYINAEISFKAFQSIFVEDQATDNKVDVFLVGGLDLEDSENSETPKGKPSNKSYKFSLTLSNGKVSASEQTELADASEPMLLPALAPQKDNYGNIVGVLAVGGRPNNSEYSATFISESDAQDRGNDSNLNLFFTNNVALNNNLYTFGGFNNSFNSEENKGEIKNSNKI